MSASVVFAIESECGMTISKDAPSKNSEIDPCRIRSIVRILKKKHPDARCTLEYSSPLQLLVATILAAQCTDKRVNIETKSLFRKYPDASSYAEADLEQLQEDIRSTGFFRQKAKSLKSCCSDLVNKFDGEVPSSLEDLVGLAGVGRKTANVILGNAFGIPGIVVDTHVARLSIRIGLTGHAKQYQEKIERDLMNIVPKQEWTLFSHLLVFHGRSICLGRVPICSQCPIRKYCDYEGPSK